MRGGVRRLLDDPVDIEAVLGGQGWAVGTLPPVATDDELWDGLVAALRLSGWFGRNLDALDESLRDLDEPTALVLTGWTTYARARPERWRRLLDVLTERTRQPEPPFLLVLADV